MPVNKRKKSNHNQNPNDNFDIKGHKIENFDYNTAFAYVEDIRRGFDELNNNGALVMRHHLLTRWGNNFISKYGKVPSESQICKQISLYVKEVSERDVTGNYRKILWEIANTFNRYAESKNPIKITIDAFFIPEPNALTA
jgi:hypothetical protein